MEKWYEIKKGADFQAIAERFGISPVTARLIRNRGVIGDAAIDKYLNGTCRDLYDPHLLYESEKLVCILSEKIRQGRPIRIIGDYDIDGVMSTYILYQGITRCGGSVSCAIPDRMRDGYGINEHLIDAAYEEGMDTIITCDNGIAAINEIAHAKELGMTVLVTDHHEIPYVEEQGVRRYLRSAADAIVNPKQQECSYPYKGLCGATVAWKIIQLLYEKFCIDAEEAFAFLEFVAFATVGDVMELTDENRILVREGLKRLNRTANLGMRALILQNQLTPEQITSYHIGFVLGPCVNASGRLETAKIALNLFLQKNEIDAGKIAKELVELNAQRKSMTADGVELAKQIVDEGTAGEKVLVIYLPGVHESLAGIIAGRIRESYHKPVFVLTDGEEGVKGSGRSTEAYSMYDEMCKCRECFSKFGGHPMAAGLSLPEENVEKFRRKINENCPLTVEEVCPDIHIDMAMPVGYASTELVHQFALLEPFGKDNPSPLFADRNLSISRMWLIGKNRNVLRMSVLSEYGQPVPVIFFGDVETLFAYFTEKFGQEEVENALHGRKNRILFSMVYTAKIDFYQGNENLQLEMKYYR